MGPAVDLDAPDHRVTGKTSVRQLQVPSEWKSVHAADVLAKQLFVQGLFRPKDLAAVAVEISKLSQDSSRMVRDSSEPQGEKLRKCIFLAGAFSYGGMTGVKSNTRDHPWVARYLTAYLSQYSRGLFAGVGLILNTDHELHRDLHNQWGIDNLILPVVTSGGGLWIQDPDVKDVSQLESDDWVVKQKPKGKQVAGRVRLYKPHQIVKLQPDLWHESVSAAGQQLLPVGYTPHSLHKLDTADRDLLWSTGLTLLPASKDEYWGFDPRALVLTRHHRVPRRHMYAPSCQKWLPVARQCVGDIRYCVQQFRDGDPVRSGRGKAASSTWTGSSAFKLRDPSSCAEAGG